MAAAVIPLMVTGTVISAVGTLEEGRARREIANRKAANMEEEADRAIAISHHEKEAERKKKNLIASRALTLLAAGGGSASDVGAINLMADIEGEGALRESTALYRGEEESRKLKSGAEVTRRAGQLEYSASKTRALGTAISGGASVAAYKYRPKASYG